MTNRNWRKFLIFIVLLGLDALTLYFGKVLQLLEMQRQEETIQYVFFLLSHLVGKMHSYDKNYGRILLELFLTRWGDFSHMNNLPR